MLAWILNLKFAGGGDLITSSAASDTVLAGALGTAIKLQAAAADFTAAAAQINTEILLDGAIQSVTAAAADLSTIVELASDATEDTDGSGTLSGTSGTISANATEDTGGSGSLNTAILMMSSAVDLTTAIGNLATKILPAASALSITGLLGTLETGIQVRGGGAADIAGAGTLSTGIKLVSAAASGSAAAADLLTSIQAAANAADDSAGVGQLKTQVVLSQAITAVSTAVGALSTLILAIASAQDVSTAGGALSTKPGVLLAADAVDDSTATADLGTRGDMQPAPATDDSVVAGDLATKIQAAADAADVTTGAAGLTTFLDPDANATDDTAASGVLGFSGSTLFTADVLIQITPQSLDTEFGLFPIGRYYQRVGDKLCYAIDWTGWLAAYWKPNVQVAVGDVVRPWQANGYQYRCVYPGVTAAFPPSFTASLNAIVQDGAAQWRCAPLDNTSLSANLVGVVWTPPQGIVITKEQVVGLVSSAVIDTSAATAYTEYDVMATATASDGRQRVGKLVIVAR